MPLSRQIAALPSSQILSLLLAAALSAAILVCAVLFHQHDLRKQEQYQRQYGQALADLAARQAVDATLNHDLVSLQVLLSDIAANEGVIGATIHNVENRLLVQGGHKPSQSSVESQLRRSFTAVISLHESIAGYVTVTLSLEDAHRARQALLWQFLWAGIALTLSLITVAFISEHLKRRRDAQQGGEEDEYLTDVMPIVEPSQMPDQKLRIPIKSTAELEAPRVSVALTIKVHNLSTLGRQLNKHSFNARLEQFEQQLTSVIRLYNAERLPAKSDEIELRFCDENSMEASFRALCSAQLLLVLSMKQSGPALKLGAQVSPFTEVSSLADGYEQALCREAIAQQVLIFPSLITPELLERVEIANDEHTKDARLVQIAAPYGELIEKQVSQLSGV